MTEPLETTLRRLKKERDEADRRYNDALTALDRAVPSRPDLPDVGPALDEHQLATLNQAWNTLPEPPAQRSGLRGRLGGFVWGMIGPYLQRQLTFNSVLVDHLNRNAEAQKSAHARHLEAQAATRAYLDTLGAFHAHLMLYLQQITAYVDTKDYDHAGGALVVNAAVSAVADAQSKYAESFAAREQRHDARIGAIHAAAAELRTTVGVLQQALTAVKRHVDADVRPAGPAAHDSASSGRASSDPFAATLDAYKYVGFENEFRGPQSLVRERQESYLPHFEALQGDVLDVGCGRGEFIDLLNRRGIGARGIDLNSEMVEVCRARGLNVERADAVGYLETLPDESLGGLFAAQVVEHLEPAYLLRFLELAAQKVRPGGPMVLETLNPACWTAFFESYIRDITHRWPLHPDTLRYFVLASGFATAAVEWRSPVPVQDRLQPVAVPVAADATVRDLAEVFNGNVEKVNARMFTHMDYAVVARKAERPR
jgi:2-polyprenyl-3-methyl-5-hydroxy-6-metoxy-1,4-benzoquinol methylase